MKAAEESVPAGDGVKLQSVRKKMEILLRHLLQIGTRRNGRLGDRGTWLSAVMQEHSEFPFGGILVRTTDVENSYVIGAEGLAERECLTWNPPAPPILRQPKDLAMAMAPLLRSATQIRFVDPYFDSDLPEYFEPMKEYLSAAQQRRTLGELQIQIHFSVRNEQFQGKPVRDVDIARQRLDACVRNLTPLLRANVKLNAFAWGEATSGLRMHNRYLLSEVGGIAIGTGLDQSQHGSRQTDDLTIMSKEQLEARWAEFSLQGTLYPALGNRQLVGGTPASH